MWRYAEDAQEASTVLSHRIRCVCTYRHECIQRCKGHIIYTSISLQSTNGGETLFCFCLFSMWIHTVPDSRRRITIFFRLKLLEEEAKSHNDDGCKRFKAGHDVPYAKGSLSERVRNQAEPARKHVLSQVKNQAKRRIDVSSWTTAVATKRFTQVISLICRFAGTSMQSEQDSTNRWE